MSLDWKLQYEDQYFDHVRYLHNPRFQTRISRSLHIAWIIDHKSTQYTNWVLIPMIRYKNPPSLYTSLIMSYSLQTRHIVCKLGVFFKKTTFSLQTIKCRMLGLTYMLDPVYIQFLYIYCTSCMHIVICGL